MAILEVKLRSRIRSRPTRLGGIAMRIAWVAWVLLASNVGAADSNQGPVVLKAARMFDGKSDRLISPGLVVVTGGKITGVGARAMVPAGAVTIDLGDATLLPGFIDAHTHLSEQR